MASIIQLDSNRKPPEESPLTPELKAFIDAAIVPILLKQYLAKQQGGEDEAVKLAEKGAVVAQFPSSMVAIRGLK